MHNYYPLLLVGGIIGTISLLLLIAYGLVKDKKEAMGFERNMKDSEIMQRLVKYAAPYKKEFIFVGFLMLFSIAYSIISPLIVGQIEELVVGDFPLNTLFSMWRLRGHPADLHGLLLFSGHHPAENGPEDHLNDERRAFYPYRGSFPRAAQ